MRHIDMHRHAPPVISLSSHSVLTSLVQALLSLGPVPNTPRTAGHLGALGQRSVPMKLHSSTSPSRVRFVRSDAGEVDLPELSAGALNSSIADMMTHILMLRFCARPMLSLSRSEQEIQVPADFRALDQDDGIWT